MVVMLMKKKSALSPPLSVKFTVTLTVSLVFPERSTQEGEKLGGPEEMNDYMKSFALKAWTRCDAITFVHTF